MPYLSIEHSGSWCATKSSEFSMPRRHKLTAQAIYIWWHLWGWIEHRTTLQRSWISARWECKIYLIKSHKIKFFLYERHIFKVCEGYNGTVFAYGQTGYISVLFLSILNICLFCCCNNKLWKIVYNARKSIPKGNDSARIWAHFRSRCQWHFEEVSY